MIVIVDFAPPNAVALTIVGAYLFVTLVIGYLLRRSPGTASQFLHARHTLPTAVTSLAFLAANCGVLEIVGIVAATAKYGAVADPLMTRDTVALETPASFAMPRISICCLLAMGAARSSEAAISASLH
jgi:hypothetical protein